MVFRLKLYESLLNSFLHQIELPCNLLIVTTCEYFIQFLHSLVISFYVLSLRLDFVVKFEGGCNYVFSLDNKVIKVLLLIGECGTCRALTFIETFLYHFQALQIDELAELLIAKRRVVFEECRLLLI